MRDEIDNLKENKRVRSLYKNDLTHPRHIKQLASVSFDICVSVWVTYIKVN